MSLLTGILIIMFILWPVAAGVSYARALRRSQERMRARRLAEGRLPEPSTHRRWKTYRRDLVPTRPPETEDGSENS